MAVVRPLIGASVGVAVVRLAIVAYIVAIVGVILLSWFPQRPGSAVTRMFDALRSITDPVLMPLRRVLPPVGGVLDLSPTIVLLALLMVYRLVS